MKTRNTYLFLGAWLALAIACGGSPTAPGAPGPSGATITISASGVVSPKTVDITVGQSVTVINNDSHSHEIASDPHPSHNACPQINALGVIGAGQTKLTNALPTARSCGFHDHQDPSNANLQGTIVIH